MSNIIIRSIRFLLIISRGDKDRKGFIPTENFTILIDHNGKRLLVMTILNLKS